MAGEITLRELSPQLREFIENSGGGGSINADIKTCGFTAEQGQTTFTIPFENYIAEECYLDVKVNSIWVSPEEYSINGKEVTFNTALEVGTEVFFTVYLLGTTAVSSVSADVVVENESRKFVTSQEKSKIAEIDSKINKSLMDEKGYLRPSFVSSTLNLETGLYSKWTHSDDIPQCDQFNFLKLVGQDPEYVSTLGVHPVRGDVYTRGADFLDWKRLVSDDEVACMKPVPYGINQIKDLPVGVYSGYNFQTTFTDFPSFLINEACHGTISVQRIDEMATFIISRTDNSASYFSYVVGHMYGAMGDIRWFDMATVDETPRNKVLTTLEQVNNPDLETGIYSVESVPIPEIGGSFFVLIVNKHRASAGWGTQIAVPYENGIHRGMFYRNAFSTTSWGAWERVSTEQKYIPSLLNGWSNFGDGWSEVCVKKVGNEVFVSGLIKGGSWSQFIQLPSGFIPTSNQIAYAYDNNNSAIRVDINTGGQMILSPYNQTVYNTWVTLNQIKFRLD